MSSPAGAARRNPFSAQGVSQYPPVAPLVGQAQVFGVMQELIADLDEEGASSFCAVYGDWGIGKTRLAHELVAEVTGKSAGWLVRGETPATVLQPLARGGVLPVFTSLIDVVQAAPENWYRDESLLKCARVALRGLCAARGGREFWAAMASDLQQQVAALGAVDWAELEYQLEAPDADPVAALETLRRATGGAVRRLLIIVDEVETPHEVQAAATPEQRARDWPLDESSIRLLFDDMKAAAGQPVLPGFAFLFLCSPGVRAAAGELPALKRRLRSATLTRASGDDLRLLMQALERGGYYAVYPGRLLEAAFLAADRNFGWFSYLMHPLYRELTAPDRVVDVADYAVLQSVAQRVGKIFRPALIEERELPPAQKEALRRLAYRQLPATAAELGVETADLNALLEAIDPYGDPLAAEVGAARLSADALIRGLLARGYTPESDQATTLVGEGSTPFDPSDLVARFVTFRAAEDTVWFYRAPAEFARQIGLLTADFAADLSERTKSTLHTFLQEQALVGQDRVAPAMSLLLRFNERWAVSNQGAWLEAGAWRRTEDRVLEFTATERNRRVCLGAALLALRSAAALDPTYLGAVSSPVLLFSLASGDPLALSARRALTVAFNHDPAELVDTLAQLPEAERGAVLVLHPDTARRDRFRALIAGETRADLAACVVERLLESGSREYEFCLRYALLGVTFRADDLRPRGRTRRDESERAWQSDIATWKTRLEQSGRLLRPLAATAAMTHFRPAYAALLRGVAPDGLTALPNGRALREGYDTVLAVARGGDTLRLFDEAGQPLAPPLYTRLLSHAATPRPLSVIAAGLLYDRGARADVSFPENPQIPLRQALQLLAELGLMRETADGWRSVSGEALAADLVAAGRRLGAPDAPPGSLLAGARALAPGYAALARRLLVDPETLLWLGARLSEAVDLAASLDPALALAPGVQPATRAALLARVAELRALAGVCGDPAAEPEPLPGPADEALVADTNYARHSIAARLRHIAEQQRLAAAAAQQQAAAVAAAHASVAELARTSSGQTFPVQPALGALAAAAAGGDSALLQAIAQRTRSAHTALEALIASDHAAEPAWEATLQYFEAAADIDQFLPRETIARCDDTHTAITGFAAHLASEYPAGTLNDLERALVTLSAAFTAADEALAQARAAGRADIERRLADGPLAAARRAAARAGRADILAGLGDAALWQAPTRAEQAAAAAALTQRALAAGASLCGGDEALFREYQALTAALGGSQAGALAGAYRDKRDLLDRLAALRLLRWHVAVEL